MFIGPEESGRVTELAVFEGREVKAGDFLFAVDSAVQTAEVELIADLATAKVQVSDILNMKVGDVIPLELDDSVTAKVDGVPVMECNYGTFNGQYALRVNRMLNMSGSESATESDDDN